MFLLRRPFLIAALIALWPTAGMAKDIPGAPKAVLGDFGVNDAECRSYHRKRDNYTRLRKDENGKYYHSWCTAKLCSEEVVRYRRTANGIFILKLKFTSDSGSTSDHIISIKQLGRDIFSFQSAGDKPQEYIRCGLRHAIAGIGLQPEDDRYDGDYKVYYALVVSRLCPSLGVDAERAAKRLQKNGAPDIDEMIVRDVELDFEQIPRFCKEVLGAYGKDGRVIPDMLWEASDKPAR